MRRRGDSGEVEGPGLVVTAADRDCLGVEGPAMGCGVGAGAGASTGWSVAASASRRDKSWLTPANGSVPSNMSATCRVKSSNLIFPSETEEQGWNIAPVKPFTDVSRSVLGSLSDFELRCHKYRERAHFCDDADPTAHIDDPGCFPVVGIHLSILEEAKRSFGRGSIGVAALEPIFLAHGLHHSQPTRSRVSNSHG